MWEQIGFRESIKTEKGYDVVTPNSNKRYNKVSKKKNIKLIRSIVYGTLTNWNLSSFVQVSINGGYYYGGFQGWLTDEGVAKF